MKKLVLFMVFVLLMTLFIAFNYLLWDRDSKIKEMTNLQSLNAGKSISLDAQDREIEKLEKDKESLQSTIEALENEKKQMMTEINQLTSEKGIINRELINKIDLLNILRKTADLEEFSTPVRQWVDAVNAGEYEAAYNLEFSSALFNEDTVTSQEYSNNLKTTVKSIKFKSYRLDEEKGLSEGDIYLIVTLEVELLPDADPDLSKYRDGLNDITVRIDYNSELNRYFIGDIT